MNNYNPDIPQELALLPPNLNIQEHPDLPKFLSMCTEAQRHISELSGMLDGIKNPDIFLDIFYLYESIKSSSIENIETELSSVLDDSLKPEQYRINANKEVIRYSQAIVEGWKSIYHFDLTNRTIKTTHKNLMVKGNPGEYRKLQNQIVSKKGQEQIALYTPPSADKINGLISNWEKFVHNDDQTFFPLLKTIICHYQFEAIHPFEDGNGRTGRILMVLQLGVYKLLSYPVLFISDYLYQHNNKYKELLLNVTKYGNWWEFIEFMLEGYTAQAKKTKILIKQLEHAKRNIKGHLYNNYSKMGLAKSRIENIVDHIFKYPHTTPANMSKELHMSRQTCSKYLNNLSDERLLKLSKSGRYNSYINKVVLHHLSSDKRWIR